MARRDTSPDLIEALARGLDVIRAFGTRQQAMPLAAVAAVAGLARPTARRILLTLTQPGYARPDGRPPGRPSPQTMRATGPPGLLARQGVKPQED